MILYNTIMGVAAGTAMVMLPVGVRKLNRGEGISAQGWALSFGVLGIILAVLGGLMAVTWPLNVKPQANILFGEPTLFLGLLLLAAAVFLWRNAADFAQPDEQALARIRRAAEPASWLVFTLGLILLACTVAIFRFNAIGGAPPQEPIWGMFANQPWIENTQLGIFYALPAIATLLAPAVVRNPGGTAARVSAWCLAIGGICLCLYSATDYFTHIGLVTPA